MASSTTGHLPLPLVLFQLLWHPLSSLHFPPSQCSLQDIGCPSLGRNPAHNGYHQAAGPFLGGCNGGVLADQVGSSPDSWSAKCTGWERLIQCMHQITHHICKHSSLKSSVITLVSSSTSQWKDTTWLAFLLVDTIDGHLLNRTKRFHER
ncbi:hypothetical protein CALVIDRAFT_369766 [Calocera viscosa TUFC12733]|uniref:Uncharacterized protein n=1 Tax=Calocera viscosa (strain TUFC12733) TaxID=1330018 RepID=A0A167GX97_CALVF|nr:hypothetical protein CALVIDRAFT_369766 [Calocera viscosa TUFC12733]